MADKPKAVAFDLDPDSLANLRRAFPEWEVEVVRGATADSLDRDWNPGMADLLIIGARAQVGDTLSLCRGLRGQAGRAHTPLLVLVSATQPTLVSAALEAGATSCLVLPADGKDIVRMVARALAGNQPGRHTRNTDQAQREDEWRDDGGEA